ncbi:MAG: hypothetical protein LBD03_07815 [Methanobrevibacter sp.]|nr:hypothetical protein [Candidatus Methanovirga procula]
MVYNLILLFVVCINLSCLFANEDSSTVGTNVFKSFSFNGMWLWVLI